MKKYLLFLLIFINCQEKPNNKNQDLLIGLTAVAYNFSDDCLVDYKVLSSAYNSYLNVLPTFKEGSKVVIIGDSTMDLSRPFNPWSFFTDNRAISGNTACDFLYQSRSIGVGYETAMIATMDGNGILRGVSLEASVRTLKKVVSYAKDSLKVSNVILLGVHPIRNENANIRKNAINGQMKAYANQNGYCFIDMVELFGKTELQMADESQMIDDIHYKDYFYPLIKSKIKSQCNIDV
jgi:hypothetical protein